MPKVDGFELSQCPFCANAGQNGALTIESCASGNHREYWIQCGNCGACGPTDLGKSGAAAMWNMRREEFPGGEK